MLFLFIKKLLNFKIIFPIFVQPTNNHSQLTENKIEGQPQTSGQAKKPCKNH